MSDLDRYKDFYHEFKKLGLDDTLQLVLNADTSEEREFFELISNFMLQKRQQAVIEANKF